MAILTPTQVAGYASAAGFTGQALRIIVAIAQAESDFDTTAHNPGHQGDIENSWGLWQINLDAHPEVTVDQATDPTFAANYAYTLYTQSGGFTDWGSYNSGAYQQTTFWKSGAVPGGPPPISFSGTWTPQDSLEVWPWLTRDGKTPVINNPYHSSFESSRGGVQDGVGLAVPLDTPITSLTSGTVIAADFGQHVAPAGANWNYGGYILVRSQLDGIGIADVFYRHMDTLAVKQGDSVLVGQLLGLSGGQTSGGVNPESSVFSTGPHLDIGLNPQTLPVRAVGPNRDPTPWLNQLLSSGPPIRDRLHLIIGGHVPSGGPLGVLGTGLQKGVVLSDQLAGGTGPVADSFLSIEEDIDFAMQFIPIDWSNIAAGTHWWDYVLPWQWGYVEQTATNTISTVLVHNGVAFLLRVLAVLIGVIIILALIFQVVNISGATNAATQAVSTGATPAPGVAAEVAPVAEVAAV